MPEEQLPEINVQTLARKLASGEAFILLDVRESWELDQAKITDGRLAVAPMSRLANVSTEALPESAKSREAEIYILCNHGNRSAQVTAWLPRWLRASGMAHGRHEAARLVQQGWTNVRNVRGGIDEYAAQIDRSVRFY